MKHVILKPIYIYLYDYGPFNISGIHEHRYKCQQIANLYKYIKMYFKNTDNHIIDISIINSKRRAAVTYKNISNICTDTTEIRANSNLLAYINWKLSLRY